MLTLIYSGEEQHAAVAVPKSDCKSTEGLDARQNREVRDRAQTVLEKMADCGFVCTLGLYGDLSAAVAGFLRLFDVEWHDPAKTIKQKKAFIQQLPGRNLQCVCHSVSPQDPFAPNLCCAVAESEVST